MPKSRFALFVDRWRDCQECSLAAGRRNVVLCRGVVPADVVFCGQGPGHSEDAKGIPFCLHESHRVLMADLSWKPLGDIVVGDRIIAPDEYGEPSDSGSASGYLARKWRVAVVANVHRSKARCKMVVTEHADLVGTADHRVLTAYKSRCKVGRWLRIDQLCPQIRSRSSQLALAIKPWVAENSYDAGWLAGFFDGEGHVGKKANTKTRCGFSQNSGELCERAKSLLTERGFTFEVAKTIHNGVTNEKVYLLGGFKKVMEFLGVIRPGRLIENFDKHLGLRPQRVYGVTPSVVRCVGDVGEQNVVDISTTTGTFVCEGFIVHNCGPSGKLLDQIVERALDRWQVPGTEGQGYNSVRVAFCNLVCCIPLDADGIKDVEPPPKAIKACGARLREFLSIARPRLLVAVGALAEKWLKPGHAFSLVDGGCPQVAIDHPAYILRLNTAAQGTAVQRAIVRLMNAVEEHVICHR